jgi:hypothetical protein
LIGGQPITKEKTVQIENLNEKNVEEIEQAIKEMKEHNPDIISKTFSMDELLKGKAENEMLQEIADKVDAIGRKLDLIFGEHKLINGKFIVIK